MGAVGHTGIFHFVSQSCLKLSWCAATFLMLSWMKYFPPGAAIALYQNRLLIGNHAATRMRIDLCKGVILRPLFNSVGHYGICMSKVRPSNCCGRRLWGAIFGFSVLAKPDSDGEPQASHPERE